MRLPALTLTLLCLGTATFATEPTPAWPTDSVYHLASTWTDQAGKRTALASFAGHPVLVAMIYTTCRGSCPLTISEMQAIEAKLSPAAKKNTRFVLVSFDPARDGPKRLAEVAKEHHLAAPSWTLLTGSADDVRELAAVLGFKYQAIAGGEFTHSNLLSALGPDGVIRQQLEGAGQDPAELVKALER